MKGLIVYCRAGFEAECGAELAARAKEHGGAGTVTGGPGAGYAAFEASDGEGALALWRACSLWDFVFGRQVIGWFWRGPAPAAADLPATLRSALAGAPARKFSAVFAEAPDTEAGKRLWPECRRLSAALEEALTARKILSPTSVSAARLHAFLPRPGELVLGLSDPARSSPWPLGIPRLRVPAAAPSRSAQKLEEALLLFLSEEERVRRLKPGMTAVDLGAAPGGWTWQLTRRGLRVAAVDNGPLDPALLASRLVTHIRADGYTWRPEQPVDWLVCDMVAAPARVARLVGLWAAKKLCKESLFNLKLPSGDRLAAVRRAAQTVRRELDRVGARYALRFKQLYHDREEITGHLRVVGWEPAAKTEEPKAAKKRPRTTGRVRTGRRPRAHGPGAAGTGSGGSRRSRTGRGGR
ncbi:MAG: 23S rRNA (cytidine(2498)-2'-O)-methyltransferase RlmM [Deltaproteobacteria bacterium]|nr:23S rRNA (cytidine(2498)-2'-O)-methyltransferase RlmM [Deltaproteobacteria bacterium]